MVIAVWIEIKERTMIEKTENPLDLGLAEVESMINELQPIYDECQLSLGPDSELEESGISLDIIIKTRRYSYTLEQLKKLKTELLDPVMIAAKEFA
jgi:hypothetical protein